MHEEGYWNYDHQCLQHEDTYDVLSVLFPRYDIVILSDQSSGHGKRLEDGLHAPSMNVYWGGKQPKMHDTIVEEIGEFPSILKVGDVQSMIFQKSDNGPFYISHPRKNKYPRETDTMIKETKTKSELLNELYIKHKISPTKNLSLYEVHNICE